MKIFAIITCFCLCSCASLDKKGFTEALKNNSFEWFISFPDTSKIHRTHFFDDSLYVLAFNYHDTSYSQVGYWEINKGLFKTSLRFTSRIEDGEIALKSYKDDVLDFSTYRDKRFKTINRKARFKATRIMEKDLSGIRKALVGSWFDPLDSIVNPISEYSRTGKFLGNATFRFTKDSFDIRTEDYREKGRYRIADCGHTVLVLESERYYRNNVTHMTIDIDYIDSTQVMLRFDKNYKLKRNGA